jgi:hypothetical protein
MLTRLELHCDFLLASLVNILFLYILTRLAVQWSLHNRISFTKLSVWQQIIY